MTAGLVYSHCRPVRVAFLVDEDSENFSAVLSAIFSRCFGFWGGRFSIIVPCKNGKPIPSYIPWLSTYDPDVIYSYAEISDEAATELNENISPSFLVQHKYYRLAEASLYPRLPIDPLKSTTLVPIAAAPSRISGSSSFALIDAMGLSRNEEFLTDSFGICSRSFGHSFPAPLLDFGHTITILNPDQFQPREQYIRAPHRAVGSVEELLAFMSVELTSTVSQLSSLAVPRLELSNHKFSDSLNIVVGDSFADRVFYWNARSLFPKWRDGTIVDLRIPESALESETFLSALSTFLLNRNHVSGAHDGGGSPQATIRSASVSIDKLDALATSLKNAQRWGHFSSEVIASVESCLPSLDELANSAYVSSDGIFSNRSHWIESQVTAPQIRISTPIPDHLRFNPPSLHSAHEGAWAVDIDLPRTNNLSEVSNREHRWRIPRRLRLTSSFIENYDLQGPNNRIMVPRISRGGILSCYGNSGAQLPPINEPDDSDAIRTALISGRDWPHRLDVANREIQACFDARRSENGRYFWGTLKVFGSLQSATDTLLHKFWLEQFQKLGASQSYRSEREVVIKNKLKNRFRRGPLNVRNEPDSSVVANVILDEAELYRSHTPIRSWYEISKDFNQLHYRDWKSAKVDHLSPQEVREHKRHEAETLARSLKELCRIGVVHQGYEHRCPFCLHRSWIAIDTFESELACEVCREQTAAPVNSPWQFRLNEFVREALRKHGVLPLFWALSRMRDFKDVSFFFEGPINLNIDSERRQARQLDPELDLLVASNGIVRACEVKQSAIKLSELNNFVRIVKSIRPNIATIALMEPSSPNSARVLTQLADALVGTQIRPEVITLEDNDFEEALFLI